MVGVFVLCVFYASVFAESDFVYESKFSVGGELTDRLSAEIETEFAFSDDASTHSATEVDLKLNYEILEWLEGGIGYKQNYSLEAAGWEDENRPYVQAAVKWKWGDWEWKNRAMLEYRMKQDKDEYFRFKNKTTVKSPWKWTKLQINSYVADQIYIDENDDFYENKTYLGVGLKFFEHVYGDIYYALAVEKDNGDWDKYKHSIVTKLSLKI